MFTVIHVPLNEQRPLFERIFTWLRRGGHLLASVGYRTWTGYADDWYGAPMYWSQTDASTYLQWLREIGFIVLWQDFIPEGLHGGHLILLAQRPL